MKIMKVRQGNGGYGVLARDTMSQAAGMGVSVFFTSTGTRTFVRSVGGIAPGGFRQEETIKSI